VSDLIYLDHHATTPCDQRVADAMIPYLVEHFGNPSSTQYSAGRRAKEAVEQARAQVAELVAVRPSEVIFTAGASESINLALKGLAASRPRHTTIVTSAMEHDAVLATCESIVAEGGERRIAWVDVSKEGLIDVDDVATHVGDDTLAVAIMAANNEVGTVQPIAEVGRICRAAGAPLLVDLAQILGKIPVSAAEMDFDLAALSAHKFYGPKGVGALIIRRGGAGERLTPLIHGASYERGLRAGTLNVPGIVGMGAAAELARTELEQEANHVRELRQSFLSHLSAAGLEPLINGSWEHRLPNNLHMSFPGVEASSVLEALVDVALSAGSACSTDKREASHVLRAMGLPEERLFSSLRLGFGRSNTQEQVARAAAEVARVVLALSAR
jgi:cysteine desulfurase